jgi:hypothetical protein
VRRLWGLTFVCGAWQDLSLGIAADLSERFVARSIRLLFGLPGPDFDMEARSSAS